MNDSSKKMWHAHTKCRACGNTNLVKVFGLGYQPPANSFYPPGGEQEGAVPLDVLYCNQCTLAQLSAVIRPEILYRNYPYVTSESQTMKVHFDTLQADIIAEFPDGLLTKKWLEIGSNNGAFLESLHRLKMETLGVEPARNLAAIANVRGVKTIDREFNCPSAIELAATGYRADVIVARHVFAHIDDWEGFIRGLEMVSHKDTLVVIEVPWVVDLINLSAFDTIYHEHLSYVSIGAVQKLLEGTAFYVASVKRYSIHGGAIGIFLRRDHLTNLSCMAAFMEQEKDLDSRWRNMDALKLKGTLELATLVRKLNAQGKKVCGFGASAKATVWLNAMSATKSQIPYVCDSTEQKQGRLIPGSDIPIVPESCLYGAELEDLGNGRGAHSVPPTDYAINFAWNFHFEIAAKHKAFTDRGGRWIVPIPTVRIE